MADAAPNFSHADLLELLPRLRAYARTLSRDRDLSDDLVQGAVLSALSHQSSFTPGTSLARWMFRILRNLFIDGKRRYRPTQGIDDDIETAHSVPATQEGSLIKGEFLRAFGKLDSTHREVLVLSVIDGMGYQEIADLTGVALGTVKSRVSRARDQLARLMLDEPPTRNASAPRASLRTRSRAAPAPRGSANA